MSNMNATSLNFNGAWHIRNYCRCNKKCISKTHTRPDFKKRDRSSLHSEKTDYDFHFQRSTL